MDRCAANRPETVTRRQPWWHKRFTPVPCDSLADFNTFMGHEIALQIRKAREEGRQLALILPVGPMGMYRWAVYFLKEWGVSCEHVHGFNMDEWSDAEGNTLPPTNPGAFQNAMEQAFYGPLGELTVPAAQRNFATRENLPRYPEKIGALAGQGRAPGRGLRHRARVPHRLLGAALRRRVRQPGGVEEPRPTAWGPGCTR